MSETLRPMTVGEILDRAIQLLRNNLLLFLGVAAVPAAVSVAVALLTSDLLMSLSKKSPVLNVFSQFSRGERYLIFYFVLTPVLFFASSFSHAALTRVAGLAHVGKDLGVVETLRLTLRRFGRYLWLYALQWLLAGWLSVLIAIAGFVLLAILLAIFHVGAKTPLMFMLVLFYLIVILIAVVWMSVRYALACSACVLEDKSAWQSIRRAVQLSTGNRLRIAAVFLLILAFWTVSISIGLPLRYGDRVMGGTHFYALYWWTARTVYLSLKFALQVLFSSILAAAFTVFYYDQRIRKEGFDIEWMMQQAGLNPDSSPDASLASSTADPAFELEALPDSVEGQ
jgi:hypothetical protein